MDKIYLSVSFEEKEAAKLLGARWDSLVRKWYTYSDNSKLGELLTRWPTKPDITELVGEDRSFGGNSLFIDLIPTSCWFSNVRTNIASNDWDRLRNYVYKRANYVCEICSASVVNLEAHERWSYNNETHSQKLMRIIALCHKCHQATHFGLANILGKTEEAKEHLKQIIGFNDTEVSLHISDAFAVWRERNGIQWDLDISLITNNGMTAIKKDKIDYCN